MIDLQFDGATARLTLNRPAARNALAIAGWQALAARVEEVAATDARLLVVSGEGAVFCAGADLKEFPALQRDEEARTRFRTAMARAMGALRELPIATIARIEGACFGAGVALAMACDMRVAAPCARFAITPAKMGIGYPQEDVARLVSLVGAGWASRLLFTGEPIDAEQAERIRLVEGITDGQGFEDICQAVLACDPGSIAMLKRGISLASEGAVRNDEQDRCFDALFGSPALAERLSRREADRALPPKSA